jgi:hypothetical protein
MLSAMPTWSGPELPTGTLTILSTDSTMWHSARRRIPVQRLPLQIHLTAKPRPLA